MHISVTMPVRNSAWSLGLTARAVLRWADSLIILNHASTDSTADIIHQVAHEHPGRVVALSDPSPLWAEMHHRQRCLEAARALGADVIGIIDDDELLTANLVPTIRAELERMQPTQLLQLPWLCAWRSSIRYRANDASVWSRNMVSMGFKDAPDHHWANEGDGYCFHHRQPRPDRLMAHQPVSWQSGQGGILHFQHASWRRLLAKQALYQMIEVIRWPGRMAPQQIAVKYGGTVDETGIGYSFIPAHWLRGYENILPYLDVNAEPWQEKEVHRLIAQYGRERFQGLNLFGVA